jgi:acetylornithine deacetylase
MYAEKVREVKTAMQAVRPEADIVLTSRYAVTPLKPESNGEAELLVRSITGDNGDHFVSYGTEAGQFQDAGYSAVVCGPGDIAQAHQPNEFIEVAQLEAGHKFMRKLLSVLR